MTGNADPAGEDAVDIAAEIGLDVDEGAGVTAAALETEAGNGDSAAGCARCISPGWIGDTPAAVP